MGGERVRGKWKVFMGNGLKSLEAGLISIGIGEKAPASWDVVLSSLSISSAPRAFYGDKGSPTLLTEHSGIRLSTLAAPLDMVFSNG